MIGMNNSQIDHFAGRIANLKDENERLTAELDAVKKVMKTLLDVHKRYWSRDVVMWEQPEVAGKEIAQAIAEAEQSPKFSYGKKEVCPNCGQSMVIPNLHKCIKKGE